MDTCGNCGLQFEDRQSLGVHKKKFCYIRSNHQAEQHLSRKGSSRFSKIGKKEIPQSHLETLLEEIKDLKTNKRSTSSYIEGSKKYRSKKKVRTHRVRQESKKYGSKKGKKKQVRRGKKIEVFVSPKTVHRIRKLRKQAKFQNDHQLIRELDHIEQKILASTDEDSESSFFQQKEGDEEEEEGEEEEEEDNESVLTSGTETVIYDEDKKKYLKPIGNRTKHRPSRLNQKYPRKSYRRNNIENRNQNRNRYQQPQRRVHYRSPYRQYPQYYPQYSNPYVSNPYSSPYQHHQRPQMMGMNPYQQMMNPYMMKPQQQPQQQMQANENMKLLTTMVEKLMSQQLENPSRKKKSVPRRRRKLRYSNSEDDDEEEGDFDSDEEEYYRHKRKLKKKRLQEKKLHEKFQKDEELRKTKVDPVEQMKIEQELEIQRLEHEKERISKEKEIAELKSRMEEAQRKKELELLESSKKKKEIEQMNKRMEKKENSIQSAKDGKAIPKIKISRGFMLMFDFVTGIPKNEKFILVVFAFYENERIVGKVLRSVPYEVNHQTGESLVLLKQPFEDIPPKRNLKVIMEVQLIPSIHYQKKDIRSLGWSVFRVYNKTFELLHGSYKIPFYSKSVSKIAEPETIENHFRRKKSLELFVRIVPPDGVEFAYSVPIDIAKSKYMYQNPLGMYERTVFEQKMYEIPNTRDGLRPRSNVRTPLGVPKSGGFKTPKLEKIDLGMHLGKLLLYQLLPNINSISCVVTLCTASQKVMNSSNKAITFLSQSHKIVDNMNINERHYFESIKKDSHGSILIEIYAGGSIRLWGFLKTSKQGELSCGKHVVKLIAPPVELDIRRRSLCKPTKSTIDVNIFTRENEPSLESLENDDGLNTEKDLEYSRTLKNEIKDLEKDEKDLSEEIDPSKSQEGKETGETTEEVEIDDGTVVEEEEGEKEGNGEGNGEDSEKYVHDPYVKYVDPTIDDDISEEPEFFLEVWNKLSRTKFNLGEDSFILYLDSGRHFPDISTVTKVTITIRDSNFQRLEKDLNISTVLDINSSVFDPIFDFSKEFSSISDPTATLLFLVETIARPIKGERAVVAKGATKVYKQCTIGYAALSLFNFYKIILGEVEEGGGEEGTQTEEEVIEQVTNATKDSATKRKKMYFREGSFELPIYCDVEDVEKQFFVNSKEMTRKKKKDEEPTEKLVFSHSFFDPYPKMPNATLLIRVVKNPTRKKDGKPLLRSQFREAQWGKYGLVKDKLPYAYGTYDSRECVKSIVTSELFLAEMKTRTPILGKDIFLNVLEQKEFAKMIKKNIRPKPTHYDKKTIELLDDTMDFRYIFKYVPEEGFRIRVDGLHNLPKKIKIAKVVYTFSLPDNRFECEEHADDEIDVAYTKTYDMKTIQRCPRFMDEVKVFRGIPFKNKEGRFVQVLFEIVKFENQSFFKRKKVAKHFGFAVLNLFSNPLYEFGTNNVKVGKKEVEGEVELVATEIEEGEEKKKEEDDGKVDGEKEEEGEKKKEEEVVEDEEDEVEEEEEDFDEVYINSGRWIVPIFSLKKGAMPTKEVLVQLKDKLVDRVYRENTFNYLGFKPVPGCSILVRILQPKALNSSIDCDFENTMITNYYGDLFPNTDRSRTSYITVPKKNARLEKQLAGRTKEEFESEYNAILERDMPVLLSSCKKNN